MGITFCCKCGTKYRAKDPDAGKHLKCRVCGELVTVPNASAEPTRPPIPDTPSRRSASPQDEDIRGQLQICNAFERVRKMLLMHSVLSILVIVGLLVVEVAVIIGFFTRGAPIAHTLKTLAWLFLAQVVASLPLVSDALLTMRRKRAGLILASVLAMLSLNFRVLKDLGSISGLGEDTWLYNPKRLRAFRARLLGKNAS